MFRRQGQKPPTKVILRIVRRQKILEQLHEELGHRGQYAVMRTCKERFYWPSMFDDIKQHIRSCHQCQLWTTRRGQLPLMVSTPTTVFAKIHVDVMFMPRVNKFEYIVAARDDLTGAAEGRALRNLKAATLAKFFFEEILCRYGAVGQVTTDNGSEVQGAFTELMDRYGIPRISISPYNSRANGVVERGHFTIRQSIVKSCKGKLADWPDKVHLAFFADKCTTRRQTGYSPFYLLHGTSPILPIDLTEASLMVIGFHSDMKPEDLLALRIQQLQKRDQDLEAAAATLHRHRFKSKQQFEQRYRRLLWKDNFDPGSLVIVRNSAKDKSLDKKYSPRYLGPYEVVRRTKGGSYVLKELDGTIMRQGVAAIRLLPYVSRTDSRLKQLANEVDDEEDSMLQENSDLEDFIENEIDSSDSESN